MATGVEIEVVEILVTGLPDAGKSSFINTLNPQSEEAEGWRSTYIQVDETLHVRFIEPPAMGEFDFMLLREIISGIDVDGFLVMCDSRRADKFGEMISVLQTVRAFHPQIPCALVANKQDSEHAWPAEDIRVGLGIPNDIGVLSCVAQDIEPVRDTVLHLLYQIMGQ